jgi:hypothetical protein
MSEPIRCFAEYVAVSSFVSKLSAEARMLAAKDRATCTQPAHGIACRAIAAKIDQEVDRMADFQKRRRVGSDQRYWAERKRLNEWTID